MARDFAPVSKAIVDRLGGVANLAAVTHCMTRLRFVVKDENLIDEPALKTIDGVMGVVRNGDKCQVIIGNNVAYAYQEVLKLGNFGDASLEAQGKKRAKITFKSIGAGILDALIGTMSPLIPAIIGGSMVKLLAMILDMLGVFAPGSTTLVLLNTIGDGAFFFLPVMVAASAAIKFKTNMSLAIAIAGVLIHPNFIELMTKAAQGTPVDFAMIPVAAVKYTYTVIPALCMTWILSYIERGVDRITPAVTKNFLKPMLIVLLAAPIAIIIIGPFGIWIGTGISSLVYSIHNSLGWLAVAIMGALWPLLVMTGMHRVFTPTIIQTIAETGKEAMVMPSEIGANLSLGGASLAVAWRTKNSELRQTALAAAASAIIAGISEPALYGVAVRLKRPLIACLISGFICGAVAGLGGLASHSMAAPGLFTSVQFLDGGNPMSMVWVAGVMVLSVVLSFVLTLILGFEDLPATPAPTHAASVADTAVTKGSSAMPASAAVGSTASSTATTDSTTLPVAVAQPALIALTSPLSGEVVPLSMVNDPTFSGEIMGPGIAVLPSGGEVFAPADGLADSFGMSHALGLTLDSGVELLIHVGLDTVALKGQGFTRHFTDGDRVKAGDLLLSFDAGFIIKQGYEIITPVVITNADLFRDIRFTDRPQITPGDTLITLLPV